jgi:ubiquinone biosynthesis protein
MDGLSEERLAERLMVMSRLPQDTPRGEKILVLASKIPTLQKLGQIVARVDGIPPDVQASLQTLESGISTMTRDELVGFIKEDVGAETIERYQIRFADKILAEASVGAVIRATFVPEGTTEPAEIVCKLIKPYVTTGLPQELEIIDGLIELAENNADFYNLQGIPLEDLFEEIKTKLAEELRVTQEQANFRRAYEYYRSNKLVRVPKILDFSTKNTTFMEYLEGEKITDAFPADQKQRSILAKRLMKVMAYESLFSKVPTSIFHGDPHAGNVMHVTEDPQNPYLIGLLDWGLLGEFDREHRLEMVQLTAALKGKRKRKLHKNVGSLLRDGLPEDSEKREQIFALADQCLDKEGGTMVIYASLIEELAKAGFVLDTNLTLYIKSQATLAGIYRELDPNLKADKFIEGLASKQVMKEFPKRLLFLPAWNYRGYRSLMSNGDVFEQMLP